MVTGFDLINSSHQEEVAKYIDTYKRFVLVFGVPRAGFGHWSHLNRYSHAGIWSKIRQVGWRLAGFVARVCSMQFRDGRQFSGENPARS